MALSDNQKYRIYQHLRSKILNKLKSYNPETKAKPFHVALLGYERVAAHSFVHSVFTMLGQVVFQEIGEIIAAPHFDFVKRNFSLKGKLSDQAIISTSDLLADLRSKKRKADVFEEDALMRKVARSGELRPYSKTVDLYLECKDVIYCFELKTVKPNIDIFKETKEKLLHWKAAHYSNNEIQIRTFCALPYNPQAPEPYARWTLQGLFDIERELLVEDEFWSMLGGEKTFSQLLDIFDKVGEESRSLLEMRLNDLEGRKS